MFLLPPIINLGDLVLSYNSSPQENKTNLCELKWNAPFHIHFNPHQYFRKVNRQAVILLCRVCKQPNEVSHMKEVFNQNILLWWNSNSAKFRQKGGFIVSDDWGSTEKDKASGSVGSRDTNEFIGLFIYVLPHFPFSSLLLPSLPFLSSLIPFPSPPLCSCLLLPLSSPSLLLHLSPPHSSSPFPSPSLPLSPLLFHL